MRRRCSWDALNQVGLLVREAGLERSKLEHAWEAAKQSGSAASLEDKLVREDEHARLGEQVGIHVAGLNDREHLAVDQIQHLLPGILGHGLEAKRRGRRRQRLLRGREPYL